jgi:hypothetical protein
MSLVGLFLGLALSTRRTSVWGWGFLGLVLLGVRGRRLLAARLFLLFLPFLTALPVPTAWWQARLLGGPGIWTWFPSWI